jgi:hypothetical protein
MDHQLLGGLGLGLLTSEDVIIFNSLIILSINISLSTDVAEVLTLEGSLQLRNSAFIGPAVTFAAIDCNSLQILALAKRASILELQPLPKTALVEEMSAFRKAIWTVIETDRTVI